MKKINVYLSDKQIEALKKLAEETGINVSELIRRGLDVYLHQEIEHDKPPRKDPVAC